MTNNWTKERDAVVAAKRAHPVLTIREIARMLGLSKSKVGRMLKNGMGDACPKCGRDHAQN